MEAEPQISPVPFQRTKLANYSPHVSGREMAPKHPLKPVPNIRLDLHSASEVAKMVSRLQDTVHRPETTTSSVNTAITVNRSPSFQMKRSPSKEGSLAAFNFMLNDQVMNLKDCWSLYFVFIF